MTRPRAPQKNPLNPIDHICRMDTLGTSERETRNKERTMNADAKTLIELGAKNERREDSEGKTKSGWWMDGVFLAPSNRPKDALRELKGG